MEKPTDKEVELILEIVPVESEAAKLEKARLAFIETLHYVEVPAAPKKHSLN